MRWYYVDRLKKQVHVYDEPQETELELLGSTDNRWHLMATQAFLKGEKGFKITLH